MWPYLSELIERPVPRYTSYPPATAFRDDVGTDDQQRALNAVPAGTPLSLYLHIPYCQQICWYCGCNTGAAGRTHRLTAYLAALEAEISMIAKLLGGRGKLRRIAFGGGSPNAIDPIDFVRIVDRLVTIFGAGAAPDVSVEIDPRAFTREWAMTLSIAQVTRVSFGVQSFDPDIQAAIGRIQPVDMIDTCMAALRARGITSVNFDLMYGLPFQTIEKLDATLDEVVRMRPSRIALFGYAHVPQMFPRQRRIDASALPNAEQRFAQAAHGYDRLVAEGYVPIGFDHFALPGDPLAMAASKGQVRRNFQGFTEDQSDVLIGLGASAISLFPGAIIQNEKNPGAYRDYISEGRLAGARGVRLALEDQRRGVLIEQLLCQLKARVDSDLVDPQLEVMLTHFVSLGLVERAGDVLSITDQGRPYARNVAAAFDRHAAAHKIPPLVGKLS
ncbi:MAG: oxygen-independent coproporphyrinogen oxidase HemN [Pseudomonadota bacterium]